MREIKFRVWLPKANKMVYDIQQDNDLGDIITDHNYNNGNYILMQYIGLKDKNGKEIYEGDIVLEHDRKYIVKYEPNRGGFFPFACGDGCGCCDNEVVYDSEDVKIIGNVCENGELVKK